LIGTRGFMYKREIKNRIKKISHPLEEGKTEPSGKANPRMKTRQHVWNDLNYMEGKTNYWQPVRKDFELEK